MQSWEVTGLNRYRGNTGEVERLPERRPGRPVSPLPPAEETPRREQAAPAGSAEAPRGNGSDRRNASPHPPSPPAGGRTAGGGLGELKNSLDNILSRLDPGRLETEDLLVLAILWLLYRESGDKELLIALGAYLFL